jgi:hypothetical protein
MMLDEYFNIWLNLNYEKLGTEIIKSGVRVVLGRSVPNRALKGHFHTASVLLATSHP